MMSKLWLAATIVGATVNAGCVSAQPYPVAGGMEVVGPVQSVQYWEEDEAPPPRYAPRYYGPRDYGSARLTVRATTGGVTTITAGGGMAAMTAVGTTAMAATTIARRRKTT